MAGEDRGSQQRHAAMVRELARLGDEVANTREAASTAARRAARLQRELTDLQTAVAELGERTGGLDDLVDQVQTLADQVTALVDNEQAEPALVSWFDVTAELAPQMLADLDRWVVDVWLRYGDVHQLTGCWYRHPDVVEELWWLRACWLAAYRNPQARPAQAADWHDRWRPSAVSRLGRRSSCGEGHVEAGQRQRSPRHTDNLDAYAAWWAETRGVGEAPEPQPLEVDAAGLDPIGAAW